MDDEPEVDPQRAELEQVVNVLTPLRQHRKDSAERASHRAQMDLITMQKQLIEIRGLFNQERANQHERRQLLASTHMQQTMTLTAVDTWNEKERRMLDRLAQLRQDVDLLNLQIEEQKILLEQARVTAKARQRAVEKLACLSEALND